MPKLRRSIRRGRRTLSRVARAETSEHARLKAVLQAIGDASGFSVDREIHLNLTGNVDDGKALVDECSIDLALFGIVEGRRFLVIFECKSGSDLPEPHRKMSAWEEDVTKLRSGKAQIISSALGEIEETDLAADLVRVCYVFGKAMSAKRAAAIGKILKAREFHLWDDLALGYYTRTSRALQKATKYQILKDLGLDLEATSIELEPAVPILQAKLEMFLLGMKPSLLLKVGYVYRRASGKPTAYQRILSRDRIARISGFLRERGAILPNSIIIAFDNDPQLQKEIQFIDGKLHIPTRYCSAWIIDGQHRIYGFLGTKYSDDRRHADTPFKLPVVAFKKLDLLHQNRTFVSINYNQKRIDPTLLSDLATELPDLTNELTWPSLLVAELNTLPPLQDRIKISELHENRPITIASFAQYGLLEGLLGFDKKTGGYSGPLFRFAPFKARASVNSSFNRSAMKKQVDLLTRFFGAVHANTKRENESTDPWRNIRNYSLLRPTGVNALLLLLSRILDKYPVAEKDMHKQFTTYLRPLRRIRFTRAYVARQGGGWKGFRGLANVMIKRINDATGDNLRAYGRREKL